MDFNPWHLECSDAHEEGCRLDGDDEFTPYDNERPAVQHKPEQQP